jgi:hypothetical protein
MSGIAAHLAIRHPQVAECEARVLATLNHPHIGAIYGLEEADGVRGLVLELVDGATLAERLALGPLPISEGRLSCVEPSPSLRGGP